MSRATLGM